MRAQAKELGVAIIGGGRVGLFRGEVANRHPSVGWIGLAEKNHNRAGEVAQHPRADRVERPGPVEPLRQHDRLRPERLGRDPFGAAGHLGRRAPRDQDGNTWIDPR